MRRIKSVSRECLTEKRLGFCRLAQSNYWRRKRRTFKGFLFGNKQLKWDFEWEWKI